MTGALMPEVGTTRTRGAPRRRPVLRAASTRMLALLAVAYGVTVVVTRLYLALSGYPQIGGGEYHIAHALWGGLLLMLAVALSLLLADRWVPAVVALLGADVGLFLDEVGKFIPGCIAVRCSSVNTPRRTGNEVHVGVGRTRTICHDEPRLVLS